jgi:Skp family chaperone for outer membrane proteins
MNQTGLDDLEKRVAEIEAGNGWHESAKYVLEKLDTLTDAVKDHRDESGGKLDKMKDDNAAAHKALYDKMDAQKTMCANRPMECQRAFLPNRTFHWLLLVLIVLFGTTFTLNGTALKQNADHKNKVIEYKAALDTERNEVNKKIDEIQEELETLTSERIDELH